jgi:Double-stranded RNA binding motif
MAHVAVSTHLPPPCGFPIRPSSCTIDVVKLKGMMKSESPTGKLAELCRLLRIQQPKYTLRTTWDDFSSCTVEFAEQEFTSSLLRAWKTDAMEDAAELAVKSFLMNPSTFLNINIPEVIPTASSISALNDLCREKGWKANFEFTGSKEEGWRCSVSVIMGEEIASLGEGETFFTKRDAKIDAATAIYYWLSGCDDDSCE